jgi:hypothetical protein
MAKSHRKSHRRMRKTHRRHHRRGGYLQLSPAPISDSLFGSPSSMQSLAQGDDFAKYHVAQHGGAADYGQAFDILSDQQMLASSMSDGQLKAIADVRGLHDAQPPPLGPTPASPGMGNGGPTGSCGTMTGGRRRRRRTNRKNRKNNKRNKKSRRNKNQRRRQGGGSLGYAPVTAPGLLLDNNRAYTQAGLNPEYYQSSSTEQLLADMRDRA